MSIAVSHWVVLALVAATSATPGWPQPSAIATEPIVRAARSPGALTVREIPTAEIPKGYGTSLWAVRITGADDVFVPVNVLLLESGAFLTPAATQRFDAAIAAPDAYAAKVRGQGGSDAA